MGSAVAKRVAHGGLESISAARPTKHEPRSEVFGEAALIGLSNYAVRFETIGYTVHLRLVSLAMVDDLLGGLVLVFWSRARGWVLRERERTGNPKLWEWCQWLADRVTERRAVTGHVPANVRYGRPLA